MVKSTVLPAAAVFNFDPPMVWGRSMYIANEFT